MRAETERERSTGQCKLWIGSDGICRIDYAPHAEVTLAVARDIMASYKEMNQDRRLPLLIEATSMKSFSREARAFFSSDEAAACASAAAIVVRTPVSKVLGNFYLGLSNPRLPSRLFTSADGATRWLKKFVT